MDETRRRLIEQRMAVDPEFRVRLLAAKERAQNRPAPFPLVGSGFQPQSEPAPALFPEAGVSVPEPEAKGEGYGRSLAEGFTSGVSSGYYQPNNDDPFVTGFGQGLGTLATLIPSMKLAGMLPILSRGVQAAMATEQAAALAPNFLNLGKNAVAQGVSGGANAMFGSAGLDLLNQAKNGEFDPLRAAQSGIDAGKFVGAMAATGGVGAGIPTAQRLVAETLTQIPVSAAVSGRTVKEAALSPEDLPMNLYPLVLSAISKRPVARAKFVEKVRGGTDRPKAVGEIVSDPAMYSELDNALKADRPDLTDEARKAILDDVVAEFRVLTGADPTPAETKALSENIGAKTIAGEFTKQNPRYETYARGLIDFYTGVRKDFPKMVDDKGQQLPKEAHVLRRRIEAAIKKQPVAQNAAVTPQTTVAPTVAPEQPKPRDFKAMPDVDLDVAIGMLRGDMLNATGENATNIRQELVTAIRERSSRKKEAPAQAPVERATPEDAQAKILAILPTEGKPLLADDIANQTGMLSQDVASALMNLEIQKKISKSKGGYLKPTEAVEAPKVEEPAETVTTEPTPLPGETPEQAKARMAEEDAADANLHIPMSREEFAMGRPVEEQNGMLVRYDGKDTDGNGKWTLYDETGQNPLSTATKSKAELEGLGFTAFGEEPPAEPTAPVTVEPTKPVAPAAETAPTVKETPKAPEEAKRPAPDKPAEPKSEKMKWLDDQEAAILKRIQERRKNITSGIDPADMADFIELGAVKIAKGFVKASEWMKEMVRVLGDDVRPHLRKIWTEANLQYEKRYKDPTRARPGGEVGVNGEFYEGGQFLPTSESTVKGEQSGKSGTYKFDDRVGDSTVGVGKYSNVLVKDLFAKDPNYALWAADNLSGNQKSRAIAEYLRSRPEYAEAKAADIQKVREVLSDENKEAMKNLGLEMSEQGGKIVIGGKTYESRNIFKAAGAKFNGSEWTATADQAKAIVDRIRGLSDSSVGRGSIGEFGLHDPKLIELRRTVAERPDRSGLDRPVGEIVDQKTESLLRLGEKAGMPSSVITEQVEDVAKIKTRYEDGSKMFMLASDPGSGKTYVLGAAIRELRRAGAKTITYVTLRKELIDQIKADLAEYEIGDVKFITYPEMRTSDVGDSDVLIFDEAHSIKNVAIGENGAQQAKAAARWIRRSKFTIFSTATPFENPVQAEYLEPTGIFKPFGGFQSFALSHGAELIRVGDSQFLRWKRGPHSTANAKAARDFFMREGVFTSRQIRLPEGMLDARMSKIEASPELVAQYNSLTAAAAAHESSLRGFGKAWGINFQKRLLESAKVQRGIEEAKDALARGRNPIIFVETKAERNIDIPDLVRREDEYEAAVREAVSMNDTPPKRSDYKLPPMGVVDVLRSFMKDTGTEVINIPSAEDVITKAFGEENVAIFTGTVNPTKAQKNLDDWRSGKKKIIVATMAKGGTGLSLHDKIGDHPTTQIVINLPWTATGVKQVAQRNARYGIKSKAEVNWIFADNIDFDRALASRVGGRMADMGASVYGDVIKEASKLEEWSFEDATFSEINDGVHEALGSTDKAPESAPAPAVTPDKAPEQKAPESTPGDGKVVMRMMPRDQLRIKPEEYQPRSEPFSEETVQKIIKTGWSDESANIKAYRNPNTGETEVLGGFSTTEAAKRLGKTDVPVRMVDIPQWAEDIGMPRPTTPEAIVKAAKLYAKMDNEFATPQNDSETLRSLKELRDDGVPEEAIRNQLGPTKYAALDALSHLKTDGKFMSMLGPTDAEIVGKDRLVAAAKVVGRMRRDFPDQFKTVHEEEVFDYMTEGGKVKDVSMKKLESVIRERINDPAFASDALGDKSLDLKNKSERLEWYGGKYNPNRKDLAEKYTELANRQEEAITQQEKDAIGEQMQAVKDQIKRTDDDQADLFGMNAFFGFVPPAELKRLGIWLGKQSGVLPQGQHGGPPTLLSVSKMVDDVLNRVKTLNTSGLKGSKLAKDNLIEQDRWVRAAEFISKSLERVVQDAVPDEARQIAILHAYENKFQGPHWNALSTEERNVAAFIAREKRKLTQFIKDNDVITPMDESKFWHISHHWINPKTDKPYDFKYGKFSKAVPQAKPRTIETLEDGIAQGLKPATTNPGKLIGMSWENIMKAHVNRTVFKSLSDIESASQAGTILRPGSKNPSPLRMVERWDVLKDQGLTDNYVRYDHPVLDKKIVVPQKNGSAMLIEGPVGVDKEIFPFVKAYLESPEYNSLDKLNFAVKSLRLGLSLFHASALGMQEIANLRVPFVNIPRGKKYIADLSPEMQILHQEGLELFKGLEDVGYKNSFFDDAFKVKNVPVGKAGNMALKPVEIMRDFIFDVVQPGMKAAFAVDMYNKMYPKYRAESLDKNSKHFGETEDKMRSRLARDVVEKADGHFSGEHYKRSLLETNRFMARAYFSPSSRKFWQRIMLSPTWNREHFIVAKNVAKSLLPESDVARFGMKEMGPIRSQYRRYLLGGLLMIGTANLLNRDATEEMDGEARNIWDNPTGKKFSVRGKWNEPPYEADVKGKDEQEALYEKMANAIISKNNEEYESALVELEKEYTFNKKHLGAVISAVRKGEPIPELTRTVEGGGAYYRPLKSVFEVAEWSTDPFGKSTHKLSPLISAFGEQVFESGFKYQEGLKSFPKRAKDIIGDIAVPMSATEVLNWIQEEKTATGALIPMAGFPTSKEKTKDSAAMYYNRIAKAFLDGNREEALDLVVEYENLGFNYDPKKTQIYMRRIEQENKK